MSAPVRYTTYHPQWYRRRVSVWWWLESWPYTKFVIRELTSLAVAYTALFLLWKLRALAAGPQAYAAFLARMQTPVFLAFNFVVLSLLVFHAVTWFLLAPKAMVVRLAGQRLPDRTVQALNFAMWIVCSGLVLWLATRG